EAELFLNGVSQGRKKKGPYEYRLRWDEVVYQPGELHVRVWRDGREWTEARVQTTGAPARLALEADRTAIGNDGRDLSFITLRVLDAQGLAIRNADSLVRFEIEHPATLVATDNGDPRDLTAFPSPERRAFSGLALAIVRAVPGQSGTVRVVARSEGLEPAALELRVGDGGEPRSVRARPPGPPPPAGAPLARMPFACERRGCPVPPRAVPVAAGRDPR